MTVRIRRGVPSLRDGRFVRELGRSFAVAAEQETFRVIHFSIQRDHLHLLVEATGARALGRGMKSIGARIARAVNRTFRRRGRVLDDRYHHRVLRTPREVRNALRYVLLNARKHAAGWIQARTPFVDSASSGRWFAGWTRELPRPEEQPPVAAARSWLLRVGWLRHGRIDPAEVPGAHRPRKRP
jgi:REP element-mobilizing transposase RayT